MNEWMDFLQREGDTVKAKRKLAILDGTTALEVSDTFIEACNLFVEPTDDVDALIARLLPL